MMIRVSRPLFALALGWITGLAACGQAAPAAGTDAAAITDSAQPNDASVPTVPDAPASSPGACGRAGRTGSSDCRNPCSAGQYCDDTQSIRQCATGCQSDEQCAATEFCSKVAGAAAGSCASCASATFDAPRASCGDASRTGVTPCRYDCQPGSYCDDSGSIRHCVAGCTSDVHCGPSEYCDRSAGGTVGVCARCTPAHVAPTMPRTPTCRATNFASGECANMGAGGDGYECDDAAMPMRSDCARSQSDPGVWCCGTRVSTCMRNNGLDGMCGGTGQPPHGYQCPANADAPNAACTTMGGGLFCCP